MKCSIRGCPGHYETRRIVHTVRQGDEVSVFENVPADVCSVCGDTLLDPETVRRLEGLMKDKNLPAKFIPLYHYV